jgi:hypothetical protein
MSEADIEAGARWGARLASELEGTKFGIICLTKENQSRPWIMFEAGTLGKTIEHTFVVPYLIGDFSPSEISPGPLVQFQAKCANKSDTFDIIKTMNRQIENPLPEHILLRNFDLWWPQLEQTLAALPKQVVAKKTSRSSTEMVAEILDVVRSMARQLPTVLAQGSASIPHGVSPITELRRDWRLFVHLLESADPEARDALLRKLTATDIDEGLLLPGKREDHINPISDRDSSPSSKLEILEDGLREAD